MQSKLQGGCRCAGAGERAVCVLTVAVLRRAAFALGADEAQAARRAVRHRLADARVIGLAARERLTRGVEQRAALGLGQTHALETAELGRAIQPVIALGVVGEALAESHPPGRRRCHPMCRPAFRSCRRYRSTQLCPRRSRPCRCCPPRRCRSNCCRCRRRCRSSRRACTRRQHVRASVGLQSVQVAEVVPEQRATRELNEQQQGARTKHASTNHGDAPHSAAAAARRKK